MNKKMKILMEIRDSITPFMDHLIEAPLEKPIGRLVFKALEDIMLSTLGIEMILLHSPDKEEKETDNE